MSDAELDLRLSALLHEPTPAADPAFVDRTVAAARLDREISRARRRAWRRAMIDCAGAVVVASTFFLLSQAQAPADGMISLYGPAMAGLVMLGLWGIVSAPMSGSPTRAS